MVAVSCCKFEILAKRAIIWRKAAIALKNNSDGSAEQAAPPVAVCEFMQVTKADLDVKERARKIRTLLHHHEMGTRQWGR